MPPALPRLFGLFAEAFLPLGESHVAGEMRAALWAPPGRQAVPDESAEAFGAAIAAAAPEDAERTFAVVELLDANHPQGTPHYYLNFLGVAPKFQGQGVGSALLRTVLTRCDSEGAPAYLEATSPGNKRLYERHGFVAWDAPWTRITSPWAHRMLRDQCRLPGLAILAERHQDRDEGPALGR